MRVLAIRGLLVSLVLIGVVNGDCVNFSHLDNFPREKGLGVGSTRCSTNAHKANTRNQSKKSKDSTNNVPPDRSCTLSLTPALAIYGTAIRTDCTVAVVCAPVITRVVAGCNVVAGYNVIAGCNVVTGCDVIAWSHIVSGRWFRVSVSVRISVGVGLRGCVGCVVGCLEVHMIQRSNISYCKRYAHQNQT